MEHERPVLHRKRVQQRLGFRAILGQQISVAAATTDRSDGPPPDPMTCHTRATSHSPSASSETLAALPLTYSCSTNCPLALALRAQPRASD